jgi:hypothetical protein
MSDNNNPQDLGTLGIGPFSPLQGVIDIANPADTFLFTVPDISNAPGNGEAVFDIRGLFNVDGPINVTLGQDRNGDGIFTPSTEQLGQTLSVSSDQSYALPQNFLTSGNYSLLDPNLFLDPGESYFVNITGDTSLIGQGYEITGSLNGAVIGEITPDDASYTCNENQTYYFDKYTDDLTGQDIRVGVNDLEVGDSVSVAVLTNQFNPVLFLFNENDCSILAVDSATEIVSVGGVDYQRARITFTLQENITYGLTVETLNPGETGSYYVTASI